MNARSTCRPCVLFLMGGIRQASGMSVERLWKDCDEYEKEEGVAETENGRYASQETALILPIVMTFGFDAERSGRRLERRRCRFLPR